MLWGAGALLLGGVAAVVASELAGWPFLRQPVQNAMARAAGVPVRLEENFHVRLLWQPQLRVGRLVVAPANRLPVPYLLDASDVTLAWRWSDVWRSRQSGQLTIKSLHAQEMNANLMRTADGRASWQIGSARIQDRSVDHRAPMRALPRLDRLQVERGRIVLQDAPLQTQLLMELRGGDVQTWPEGQRTGYRATVTGRYRALPVTLQALAGGALPLLQTPAGETGSATLPLRVKGQVGASTLSFDGRAGALLGERRLAGALRFSGPSLAQVAGPLGLTLPQTPPFELTGQLEHDSGVWRLQAERFAVGRSLLNGDFRYDTRIAPGRLTGQLAGPRLVLADLAPAIGKTSAAPAGRVLPQRRLDLPSLKAMDAELQVAIDQLDFGSSAVAPLRGLKTQLQLDRGVLHLRELKAVVAGGSLSGLTSLDARTEPARWHLDLALADIDMAQWVRSVQTPRGEASTAQRRGKSSKAQLERDRQRARQGADQPVQAYLTGALSGQFKGTGVGRSTAEILASLDGEAKITLRDGTLSYLITELAGLDVAQALGVAIRGDKPLPLRCARVDLQVSQGVAKARTVVLDNADSTLRVQGQINLRDESLALRATARPKDFSPLSLRAPLLVTGPLASPVVSVDGRRLTRRAIGALALGALVAPPAALLALMDSGQVDTGDPCAPPAPRATTSPAPAPSR